MKNLIIKNDTNIATNKIKNMDNIINIKKKKKKKI